MNPLAESLRHTLCIVHQKSVFRQYSMFRTALLSEYIEPQNYKGLDTELMSQDVRAPRVCLIYLVESGESVT